MTTVAVDTSGRLDGPATSRIQRRHNELKWWLIYGVTMFVGLCVAAVAFKRSTQLYLGMSILLLLVLLAAWVQLPKVALAATVGLALIGDRVTVWWFPFNKNLSSYESISYLADSVSISPLEIVVTFALALAMYRNLATIGRPFRRAALMRPFAFFLLFLVQGLIIGLSSGGDTRAAIFELRPLLLLPLLYLLVVNTCETRRDYRQMYGAAVAAIVVQSILSLYFLGQLSPTVRDNLEDLNEHGSSIGMNLLFTILIVALLYKGTSARHRLLLLFAGVPVLWVYMVAQRRAAIVALGAAMILLAVTLFWEQRRTFWRVVPIASLLIVGYVGAFWNSESSAGFPAQAVKSVVAPDSLSEKDQSSDLYREIEKFDLSVTIRSAPVIGLGFGQKFLRPIPLPNISGFEFYEYLPHNSLLWIWIKTGFLGFVTMLYILGRSIMMGVDRFRRIGSGTDLVVALSAVLFVVMYSVYLYVEIAWEPRNVMLLALALGVCTGPLHADGPRPDEDTSVARRQDDSPLAIVGS